MGLEDFILLLLNLPNGNQSSYHPLVFERFGFALVHFKLQFQVIIHLLVFKNLRCLYEFIKSFTPMSGLYFPILFRFTFIFLLLIVNLSDFHFFIGFNRFNLLKG